MHSFVQWFLFCYRGCPLSQSLRLCQLPQGGAFRCCRKVSATAKSRPLGEGGIAVGDDGRGASRRAALSQKAARQLPFPATTPPVKMQCRSVRRRSGIALLKIIFPLNMRRATRSAFQIVPRASARYAHPLFCLRKVWYTENSILCPEGG